MNARRTALSFALVALATPLAAPAAQRTFVASYGSDAASCLLTAPCRSFATAIAAVDAGGEVVVLDSAGYGPVTIAKSVRIAAPPGVHASITIPTSGNGVTTAGGTFDVTLEGLTLVGSAGSANGIYAQHDGSLALERIGVEGAAVSIAIAAPSSVKVDLRDIVVKRGAEGLSMTNARGNVTRLAADDFTSWAVAVSNGSVVTIADAAVSNATSNGFGAILAEASGGGVTRMAVVNSRVANVAFGIAASDFGGTVYVEATGNSVIAATSAGLSAQGAGATLVASRNSVTQSGTGLLANVGGTLVTFNDNAVHGNTTEASGTSPGAYH